MKLTANRRATSERLPLAFFLLLLAGGGLLAWISVDRAARDLRQELLQQAREIAPGVNLQHLKALTGSAADLASPDYQRIKELLRDYHLAAPKSRFVYLLGKRPGGTLFVYADSELPGATGYSPPGEAYEEAPAAYHHVFASGAAAVVGPVSDRWGRWVTALVPLADARGGKPLALLGMDVDARRWRWMVAHRAAMPLVLILALVAILAIVLVAHHRRRRLQENETLQRTLMEGLGAGVVVVDAGTRVIEQVNPAAAALFGAPPGQLVGRLCHNFLCPAETGKCPVLEFGQSVDNAERELLRCDGSRLPIQKMVRRLRIDGREKLLETFIDITTQKRLQAELEEDNARRRQAESELQESKARLDLALGAAGMGVWQLDVGSGRRHFDDISCRILGLDPATFSGEAEDFFAAVHPEDRPHVRGLLERTLVNGVLYEPEFRVIWPDGSVRHVAARGRLSGGKGQPRVLQGVAWDVTPRKLAERALRDSEEKYHAVFSTASDGIVVIDRATGTIVDCNEAITRMYGYRREELVGQPVTMVSAEPEETRQTLADVPSFIALRLHRKKDGSVFPVEIAITAFTLQDRRMLVSSVRDISERRRAEEALTRERWRLQNIIEGTHAGTWEWNVQTGEVAFNEIWAQIVGRTLDELAPVSIRTWEQLAHPDDLQESGKLLERHFAGELPYYDVICRMKHKAGHWVWVHDRGRLVTRTDDGRPLLMFGTHADVTTLMQAQAALSESETNFRTFFESIGDLIVVATPDGRILYSNRAMETKLGFRAEELARMHVLDLHPADRRREAEEIFAAMFRGERAACPLPVARRDGTLVPVETRVWFGRWNGQDCIFGLIKDLSQELEAQQRFERLFRNNPALMALSSMPGRRFTDVNDSFLNILGYDRAEVIGKTTAELGLFPDPKQQAAVAGLLQANGHVTNVELQVRAKNGAILDGLFSGELIVSQGSQFFLTVMIDITRRKKAEAALLENEQRMRAITEAAHDAIVTADPAGAISFWNPAAERIFGYRSDEVTGRNLHQLLAPEKYLEAHQQAFARFRRTGRGDVVGRTVEMQSRHRDGRELTVELSLSAIELADGFHALGIMRDVSARRQVEEDLRRANAALEEQTHLAREMAIKAQLASAAKSEFLANMSHEIRTPMNGVIGMTGLLLETPLSDEQRRYAEIVRSSGESLLAVINDILDFSKIEAGKLDLEALDFDLHGLLDDLAATMALRAYDKGLELLLTIAPGVPARLRGDPGRLRQVLTNLVGNAVKFTSRGEVEIRVAPESQSDREVRLRFAVRDTGIGIPRDKRDLLFGKFSQVDASTTRRFGGTGLGLAIVKQLVELMGGEVGVASEEGKGSEFWFVLRLEKPVAAVGRESPMRADLHGVRALIADDNATSRDALAELLAAWGMRVEAVADGRAALRALGRAAAAGDPCRVAVVDMKMPDMDGGELARAVRLDGRLTGTRLVLLTSLGARGDARRFAAGGFAAYLTKPVRSQELSLVLRRIMGGEEPASEPIVTRHSVRESLYSFSGRSARLLLVEDNLTNQQVILGILKKLGLHADTVANGAEALKALENLPYDLVLMDVQMPVMDGLEATRRIRRGTPAVRDPAVPVIALTAYAMGGDRERCLEAGMNDFISKPVNAPALAEALHRWLPAPGGDGDPVGSGAPLAHSSAALLAWDREGLRQRMLGDDGLVKTIVEGFLDDAPRLLRSLRTFLDAGDTVGVAHQLHTIKGAAANISGEELRDQARQLEALAREGDLAAVAARLAALEKCFRRLTREMRGQAEVRRPGKNRRKPR